MPRWSQVTEEHVRRAAAGWTGLPETFGESKDRDVVVDGHRYPPKALLAQAHALATNERLTSDDFSSGKDRGHAWDILGSLGFPVVPKDDEINAGYVLLAQRTWLDFHAANSVGNEVVFLAGPNVQLKDLSRGMPVFFREVNQSPAQVRLWGQLIDVERIPASQLWDRFGSRVGAASKNDLDSLIGQLPSINLEGEASAVRVNAAIAPSRPIDLEALDIDTHRMTRGRYLTSDEVHRLLQKAAGVNSVDHPGSNEDGLILYSSYSRHEIHDIFEPGEVFNQRGGAWGRSGLIQLQRRKGDFVFLVTLNISSNVRSYQDGITRDGVMSWDSQDQQQQHHPIIQRLISHDHSRNSIHLFLRTRTRGNYTYLGRLAYLEHDPESDNPVAFRWQILGLDLPEQKRQEIGLEYLDDPIPFRNEVRQGIMRPPSAVPDNTLEVTDLPQANPESSSSDKRPVKRAVKIDYESRDARNRKLGLAGEQLVIENERKRLNDAGRPDLAAQVFHTAVEEGDGAGYDVRSFETNGELLYIEVKTTKGGQDAEIFLTANELAFSEDKRNAYALYRIYDFDLERRSGRMFVLRGNVTDFFELKPIAFRGRLG